MAGIAGFHNPLCESLRVYGFCLAYPHCPFHHDRRYINQNAMREYRENYLRSVIERAGQGISPSLKFYLTGQLDLPPPPKKSPWNLKNISWIIESFPRKRDIPKVLTGIIAEYVIPKGLCLDAYGEFPRQNLEKLNQLQIIDANPENRKQLAFLSATGDVYDVTGVRHSFEPGMIRAISHGQGGDRTMAVSWDGEIFFDVVDGFKRHGDIRPVKKGSHAYVSSTFSFYFSDSNRSLELISTGGGVASIPGKPRITQIGAGHDWFACLDEFGRVWIYGDEFVRTYLNRSWEYQKFDPKPALIKSFVNQGIKIKSISCGASFMLMLGAGTGNIHSCGANGYGQRGIGCSDKKKRGIFLVKSLMSEYIVQIKCGSSHAFARNIQGTWWAWGETFSSDIASLLVPTREGELPHSPVAIFKPVQLKPIPNLVDILPGYRNTLICTSQ